jgi:hypothetical protein
MGRIYSVVIPNLAVAVAQDLCSALAGATHTLKLLSGVVTQNSDVGDAAAISLRFIIKVGAAVGSGGSAVTPAVMQDGMPAADFTARRNDTTAGTGGTDLHEEIANMQIGWFYRPIPKEMIKVANRRITIEIPDVPTSSLDISGTFLFEEAG